MGLLLSIRILSKQVQSMMRVVAVLGKSIGWGEVKLANHNLNGGLEAVDQIVSKMSKH